MKKEMMKVRKKFRNSLIIRLIISAIFGFLPSFLFIVSVIQYGSPFQNYIKFLSDFNSSSGAWISAIVLAFFAYFIIGLIQSGETFKKIIANKKLLITLIILFAITIALISVQLVLYVNFTLRNDILVDLSADKESIFFTDNLKEDITFKIDLTMNPFCSAQCEYEFSDLSYGGEIDKGSFNITTVFSKLKTYTITNNNLAEGSQELKRFEVSCASKKTLLCYTREEESRRAILVTVNYRLSDEEQTFKNNSKNEIINLENIFYSSSGKLNESLENINSINNSFFTEDFSARAKDLSNSQEKLNFSLENLKQLWKSQSFIFLGSDLPQTKIQIENFENESEKLNSELISNISLYNNLTENFSNSKQILKKISQDTLTDLICKNLNKVIHDYNTYALFDFKNTPDLQNKQIITETISSEVNTLYEEYQNNGGEIICSLSEIISEEILARINVISDALPPVTFSLDDPDSVCCLSGSCEKCCDGKCSNQNYPIIFLHGQSINEAISIGYSLDTFSNIKEALTSEGYIDAGAIILGSEIEAGLWGKTNATLMMTGSYFFDTYKTETGEMTISSNQESIDTYSIRLKKLVELVKTRTNKEKVIIIAHSMGGVVTRRYLQIFGSDSVDKAILVTAPNHGVDGKVRDYCALIGPEISCRELDKNSIFINQLNDAAPPKIPLYNFIGIGCDMGDDTGDGVIKNSSQYLESAVNYYFKGTCNELNFEYFHEYISYPDRYPEVYNKIYEILKNSSS